METENRDILVRSCTRVMDDEVIIQRTHHFSPCIIQKADWFVI